MDPMIVKCKLCKDAAAYVVDWGDNHPLAACKECVEYVEVTDPNNRRILLVDTREARLLLMKAALKQAPR